MTQLYANAYPKKRFFLDMFTRDIALEDCILDLVDNSIDSLVEARSINLAEAPFVTSPRPATPPATIKIDFSEDRFAIEDNCGGIPLAEAISDTFNFGRPAGQGISEQHHLGAYGIGLKRAIFKIGRALFLRSRTTADGFTINQDVDEWAERDESLDDWRFPLEPAVPAANTQEAGTTIQITELRAEVRMRMHDGSFEGHLHSQVSRTYAWFLERYVRVLINGQVVMPFEIPIGESEDLPLASDRFNEEGVDTLLFAGVAARSPRGEWRTETAGWYVMCNGRVVVVANKDDLTGWGGGALPTFQPKYRGFLGMAFFSSAEPLLLPWTTTKRGLNREALVFQKARNRMRGLSRPVLTFFDGLYPSEPLESEEEREAAKSVQRANLSEVMKRGSVEFASRTVKIKAPKTTVKIQFDAEKDDLEKVRKYLREPNLAANQIGKYAFDYLMRMEGLR